MLDNPYLCVDKLSGFRMDRGGRIYKAFDEHFYGTYIFVTDRSEILLA